MYKLLVQVMVNRTALEPPGNSTVIYSPVRDQGYIKDKRKPKSQTVTGVQCGIITGLLGSDKDCGGISVLSVSQINCRI